MVISITQTQISHEYLLTAKHRPESCADDQAVTTPFEAGGAIPASPARLMKPWAVGWVTAEQHTGHPPGGPQGREAAAISLFPWGDKQGDWEGFTPRPGGPRRPPALPPSPLPTLLCQGSYTLPVHKRGLSLGTNPAAKKGHFTERTWPSFPFQHHECRRKSEPGFPRKDAGDLVPGPAPPHHATGSQAPKPLECI